MKMIHCSDLHLDSKMETNLTAEEAAERNREILDTFSKMVDYALAEGVRVVMISGDMFDTRRVKRKTVDYIIDRIKMAKDIDFLYLKGNHDDSRKIFGERSMPDNFKEFSDEWKYYRYENVVVAGVEIGRNNFESMYDSLGLNENDINVVMLHGQEGSSPGKETVCISRLKKRNIDYAALGHIHSYKRDKIDERGAYCYCGCLEGRGFDECGEKGFVLLETRGRYINERFVPFAHRELKKVEVDISGLVTEREIVKAIKESCRDIDEKNMVKVILTGSYTTETQKDLNAFEHEIRDDFYFVRIEDKSSMAIDPEDYRYDVSLKGEFIRKVLEDAELDKETKDKIIMCGIQALRGEEITL